MRILICEDNALVAMMVEELLVDLGHQPVGIADAMTPALEAAEAGAAEVALVDLGLADGPTGLALVAELRRRGVPSVIVSGRSEALPENHGAAAVVLKPIDEGDLIAAIEVAGRAG